jgi:hypothetical protein
VNDLEKATRLIRVALFFELVALVATLLTLWKLFHAPL